MTHVLNRTPYPSTIEKCSGLAAARFFAQLRLSPKEELISWKVTCFSLGAKVQFGTTATDTTPKCLQS